MVTPNRVSASERIYRARRVGATFARTYLGIRANRWIARRLAPSDMRERWSHFNRQSAESIYATAVELRGLILKGCQFLGTRADVAPPEYVQVLSRLQDRVPPRPYPAVRRTVEAELGGSLETHFASFSKAPIASASLAQVHEARRTDGRRVAVKVQYPEIEALVASDLSNLRVLFRAVGLFERDFDMMPVVDELARQVPLELDFVNEGRNAQMVAKYFEGRDDVAVPTVHWDLSSERVLVTDFVDGIKISDVARLREAGIDTDRVAHILMEAYCEQILLHGFFHADPHPGNILVQATPDGPRLVFLDFGLTKQLPPEFRGGVVDFAAALLKGDPDGMCEALVELGFETRDGSRRGLAEIAGFVLRVAREIRERSHLDRRLAERLREELPERIRANPIVRVPAHLVLVARVVALLSGLHRTLETKVDFARVILPYALGSQRRTPPQRS